MRYRTAAVIVAALAWTAILTWPSLGEPPGAGDRSRPTGASRLARRATPGPREEIAKVQGAIRLQRQFVEMMADPLLAGQLAVTRIKDIALKSKKPEMGARALDVIADQVEHPALRRSALFAMSELHAAAGEAGEAIKALVALCAAGPARRRGQTEEKTAQEARRVSRWLHEHPALAGRIIHGFMERHRRPAPAPRGPGGGREAARAIPETIERLHRRLAEAKERCELSFREMLKGLAEEGPRRAPAAAGRGDPCDQIDRRLEKLHEFGRRLERRSRELDEKTEHIERRRDELRRWAEELERGDTRRPQRRESQEPERRERERMERRDRDRRDRDRRERDDD